MTKADTRTKKIEEYLNRPYSRVLIPDSDGGYSAEILEFPGCYSQGETAEEAVANIEEAARNWIGATLDAGNPIPLPSTDYEYAGKVALRLPRSIHRQVIRLAEKDGVSLNSFLVTAIAARIGAEEFYGRLVQRFEDALINRLAAADNRSGKFLDHMMESLRWFE